jgi:capsular exopolysaccharide synthesis family protein
LSKQEKNFIKVQPRSFKENIDIIRNDWFPVFIITLASLLFSVIYAVNAKNIYKATSLVKISKPSGGVLDANPLLQATTDFAMDRFLLNEIEILKSYQVRERVISALLDTFKVASKQHKFYILLDENTRQKKNVPLVPAPKLQLINDLAKMDIEQKRGLDFVEVSVQSPSAYEAALIVNCYTEAYRQINLELTRNQLASVREFLVAQRTDKLQELGKSEEALRNFQEQGGIVALDQQATSLISFLSTLESKRDFDKIQMMSSDKLLQRYREELKKRAPDINAYLDQVASEEYLKDIQTQLAEAKLNREILRVDPTVSNIANQSAIKEYDKKVTVLEDLLKQKISTLKSSIFAATPEELKDLAQKILGAEVQVQAARVSMEQEDALVKKYEQKFNLLPKSSIELARLQRNRESLEKLYLMIEEKYQEAAINEQSQPGNVLIVDEARIPDKPFKPNRILIIIVGFMLGLIIAVGYVFLRNNFDNTVKTPDDIQKFGTDVLAWIPQIEGVSANGSSEFEFIVARKPDSIPAESFRALRTRVQFSRVDAEQLKTILVTSSAPSEGKTMICTNLAGSFALSNKKTLIIDCDLRKPRIHSFFKANRYPGIVDYLFGQVSFDEIVRTSEINGLFYMTAGTIPPNPSEILESQKMKDFLKDIREKYDYILLDSPPVIAVTDSEILARYADATALVVSANTTETELMLRALEIIKQDNINFIGTILNNFVYKSSYGSYYKYYYYYTRPRKTDRSKLPPQQINT